MTTYLNELLKNPFNRYCVDCTKTESTHANITYGTFVCASCAGEHAQFFGMSSSYVKPVFEDLWDSYQLKVVTIGGNQRFWDFMKDYKSEAKPVFTKYKTGEARYYKKRLAATVEDRAFAEKPPAKNVEEMVDKGVEVTKKGAKKAEEALTKVGGAIENKFNKWFK